MSPPELYKGLTVICRKAFSIKLNNICRKKKGYQRHRTISGMPRLIYMWLPCSVLRCLKGCHCREALPAQQSHFK